MLIITIKRNNLKSKVSLKTKIVCEIITIRNMSQLSTIRWQVNFFLGIRTKKNLHVRRKPLIFLLRSTGGKKTPSLHLSPGKIDVDEALGVITGKLDSKICS